jgi:hypothetical protein
MDMTKEPSAAQRAMAAELFGHYNAMRMEGFTEYQACVMLGQMLGTIVKGGETNG